ncbi:MAG: metalloregulator ArsR/SmtB family transcription factor [Nitrospirota bacterium]|nr:metalloregulator ArsR/SmtB family transcription factor [Nitrospirota bacterium]
MKRSFVEEIHQLHAELCQALADPKRILMLYALAKGPTPVGDLAEQLGIRQSNASQHLAVLRDRGLVTAERSGTTVFYQLRYPAVLQALDLLRGVLRERLEENQGHVNRLMEIAR